MYRLRTNLKHYIVKAAVITGITVIAAAIMYFLGIGCIWRYFFGIKCLGCGMTRAMLCFFRGDITGAFHCHYMFFSLPILFLYILFDGKLFRNKYINNIVLILLLTGFIINYVFNNSAI